MIEEQTIEPGTPTGYHIRLDIFEGPLDLLLHLIKENKMDIYDIQVSKITDQYLEQIELMETLNLEVAGEFLLMAATLAHLKSKLLVPPDETQEDLEDEGQDPRAELVRRLLEYQKYKAAAEELLSRPILFRDVFKREKTEAPVFATDQPLPELQEVSVFKLVDAFHKLLKNIELKKSHDVESDPIVVSDCVQKIADSVRMSPEGTVRFADLFEPGTTRRRVVVTFMAILEMLKRGALRVIQTEAFNEIYLMGTPVLYGDWKYDGNDEYGGKPTEFNS